MTLFLTLIFLLMFLILVWLVLYLPGLFILRLLKKSLKAHETIALSFCLGVVAFILLSIVLGLLHLRDLFLPLIFLIDIALVLKSKQNIFEPWRVFVKQKALLFLIFIGILTQGFINFPSGYEYSDGLLFWSSQGHDGLWHVALMEEIKQNFPPQMPLFAGESVYNYHYLVDILMGQFGRLFPFFSLLDLYFRFFPVLFSFMIGITVFSFVNLWQGSKAVGLWAVVFTYFVGSFGYGVTMLRNGQFFGGETAFWASQLNTIIGNPPHAVAISLLSMFLFSFYHLLKEKNKGWFVICILLGMVLAGVKVSAGVVLLAGLGAVAGVEVIFKRQFLALTLFITLTMTNYLTFKLITRGGESLLMWLPGWFLQTLMVVKLDNIDWEFRRQHYVAQGTWHANLRVVQLWVEAFLLFFVGNIGMRVIGLVSICRKVKNLSFLRENPLDICILTITVVGVVIPMLFVQKGIIYNNIQYLQYTQLMMGFYGAITTAWFLNKLANKKIKVLVATIIIFFSVPTVVGNFVEFYGRTPLAKITLGEIEALQYLRQHTQSDEVVLNAPFDKYLKNGYTAQPWPIYVWYSTAYISALSGHRSYLSSEEQVMIMNYPLGDRLDKVKSFFQQKDSLADRQFLQSNKIRYIYLAKGEKVKPLDLTANNLDKFFENSEVIIYRVKG